LRGLGGLSGISIEETAQTAQALEWMTTGMDFADALHIARSSHYSAFVIFDKKSARQCKGKSPATVETIYGKRDASLLLCFYAFNLHIDFWSA
jgi:hypothetical protein